MAHSANVCTADMCVARFTKKLSACQRNEGHLCQQTLLVLAGAFAGMTADAMILRRTH
jgi:hypothetical protein